MYDSDDDAQQLFTSEEEVREESKKAPVSSSPQDAPCVIKLITPTPTASINYASHVSYFGTQEEAGAFSSLFNDEVEYEETDSGSPLQKTLSGKTYRL